MFGHWCEAEQISHPSSLTPGDPLKLSRNSNNEETKFPTAGMLA